MKVYIYCADDRAAELLAKYKDAGNEAYLKNPQFFDALYGDNKCDMAVTDSDKIRTFFSESDVAVDWIGRVVTEAESEAYEADEVEADATNEGPEAPVKKVVKKGKKK